MTKRLFDNSLHGFPHSHIAKQAYGVFILPACELLGVVCLGPAHRCNFVSMRGYCSDYRTAQMACRSEYLLGIRRKRREEGTLVGRIQPKLLALVDSPLQADRMLQVVLCPLALNRVTLDPPLYYHLAPAEICRHAAKKMRQGGDELVTDLRTA
jgi:hypothetical protein